MSTSPPVSHPRLIPLRPRRAMVQLRTHEMQFVERLAKARSASLSATLRSLIMSSPELLELEEARRAERAKL